MIEFLTNNQLYIVFTIVMLVWIGIVVYLVRIDRKVSKLEEMAKKEKE